MTKRCESCVIGRAGKMLRWWLPVCMLLLGVWAGAGALASGDASPALTESQKHALTREVIHIFEQSCYACHNPSASRDDSGGFTNLLPLSELVSDGLQVEPGVPGASYLWELIRTDKMPRGAVPKLTAAQKQSVYDWIKAGCPTDLPEGEPLPPGRDGEAVGGAGDDGAAVAGDADGPAKFESKVNWSRLVRDRPRSIGWLIGQYHIALVHFPIALLVVAAFAELVFWLTGSVSARGAARWCIVLGAMGAVVAVLTGYFMYSRNAWAGDTIADRHAWLGYLTATCAFAGAMLSEWSQRHPHDRRMRLAYRILLLVAAMLVLTAGHYGGILTHGAEHYVR